MKRETDMKKLWLVLIVLFALSVPAWAQTPNRLDVVRNLASSGPGAALMQACKTSKDACGQFTRLAACALAPEGFGLLTKNPGENQVAGFAVDAIIYKPTNQVIDIISQNESQTPVPAGRKCRSAAGTTGRRPSAVTPSNRHRRRLHRNRVRWKRG
jgi:NAD(P)-dependent dehydrogenase (short-subunit alcohol dehydrogenase family)